MEIKRVAIYGTGSTATMFMVPRYPSRMALGDSLRSTLDHDKLNYGRSLPVYEKAMRPTLKNSVNLALITALGLALRLAFLGHRSLYLDEAWSFTAASLGPAELLSAVAHQDAHPPLYYMVLSAFLILGNGEFAIRLPSAIFGTLTIPLAYWLGRRFLGERAGLLAAFLLAISPMHVRYSQEARMYALLAFLALSSLALLLRAIEEGGRALWALYGLSAALCLHTHYIAPFFLLAEGALVLWIEMRRGRLEIPRGFLLAGAGALASFAPWAYFALMNQYQRTQLMGTPLWLGLVRILAHFSYFFPVTRRDLLGWMAPSAYALYIPSLLICSLLALRGFIAARGDWFRAVVCWLFAPPIAAFLILYLIAHVRPYRSVYYLFELPVFLCLAADGLLKFPKRKALASILLAFLTASYGFANAINYQTEAEDWRAAAAFVVANSARGDAIAFDRPWTRMPFDYYAGGSNLSYVGLDRLSAEYGDYGRIWMIVAHYGDPDSSDAKRFLDRHCERIGAWRFAGWNSDIWIYLYVPPPRAR